MQPNIWYMAEYMVYGHMYGKKSYHIYGYGRTTKKSGTVDLCLEDNNDRLIEFVLPVPLHGERLHRLPRRHAVELRPQHGRLERRQVQRRQVLQVVLRRTVPPRLLLHQGQRLKRLAGVNKVRT